ncbi:MAG: phosphomannomutase/phosphoglucomutase [Legionellales bacterium]|nr:phosphomannomutase/phosphoglucomutase [Legionellales bacterium]
MSVHHRYRQRLVDRSVFRAYDIRGIIGVELDEDAFYSIGLAVSCKLRALDRSAIFLARDARLSSDQMANALKQGLLDSGISVLDLGAVATPVMYFATNVRSVDSGLMVTGSHNPAEYNGIKLVLAGNSLTQTEIDVLYDLVQTGERISGHGELHVIDIMDDYVSRILGDIQLSRPLKVVVDCGNGIAGASIPQVLTRLGCEVIPLFCEVDGSFPNHHPDPTVLENLTDLRTCVAAHGADLGLAFDGDADRLGVVTNLGEVLWPDRLMMFYAENLLKSQPGATIVYDVKCSSHLATVIENAGGVGIMCPTGHSIVKRIMKQHQAALAGEMSGHLFFKDRWYGFDDALYSACRLLEMGSQSSETFHEQFAAVPNSINTPEIKIPIHEADKFSFMKRFSEEAHFPESRRIVIDGLRVEFVHGWGLIRASNTTPCLVARFEAKDGESLSEIQALFKHQLLAMNKNLKLPF